MERLLSRVQYRVKPAPPFRLDLTVWALRRVPDNIIDRWDGETYQRTLVHRGELFEVSAAQSGTPDDPWVVVSAAGDLPEHELKTAATAALERLFGLRVDLGDFYRLAAQDERLGRLVERFRGVKPPRFPTVFEAAANGIACQQISLRVGITLLNRLCLAYGRTPAGGGGHAFPQPADLAGLAVEDLRALGFSRNKARALIELSSAITGVLDLERLDRQASDDVLALLQQLRGIGRWTAEYILLRGLGRLDVFPADDIGGQGKLQRWLGLSDKPDYRSVRELLAPWARYSGLIYFHLLLNSLAESGYIR